MGLQGACKLGLFEDRDRQSLWQSVERGNESKLPLDNSNQHVGGHGAPDLRFRWCREMLDTQMLLDPFEEQFTYQRLFVQRGKRQRQQDHVVGQEDQVLARFWGF